MFSVNETLSAKKFPAPKETSSKMEFKRLISDFINKLFKKYVFYTDTLDSVV